MSLSFVSTAYAMGAQPAAGEGNMMASIMPFILIFAVFYFLLIRPQQKKAKEQRAMLEALKKGDPVITAGGMFGRIVEVDGDVMLIDLGDTKVRMLRQYLTAAPDKKQAAPALKKEKKGKKDGGKNAVEETPAEPAVVEVEAPAEKEPEAAPADDKDKPAAQ